LQSIAAYAVSDRIVSGNSINDYRRAMHYYNFIIEAQQRPSNNVSIAFANELHVSVQIINSKLTLFFSQLPYHIFKLLFWYFTH